MMTVPKIEGRPDTRKMIAIEHAECTSFLMPWEKRAFDKKCCIRGCDHKCHGNQGTFAKPDYESCSTRGPAIVADKRIPESSPLDPYVGVSCPCCTTKILDQM